MNTDKLAHKVIGWCRNFFSISDDVTINFKLDIHEDLDCWGDCEQTDDKTYSIRVSDKQGLRDFIATVVHEVVHVKQWERDNWEGDGEEEAKRLQYAVTDRMWSEGVL